MVHTQRLQINTEDEKENLTVYPDPVPLLLQLLHDPHALLAARALVVHQ